MLSSSSENITRHLHSCLGGETSQRFGTKV